VNPHFSGRLATSPLLGIHALRLGRFIFSFETAFALFLFAGRYKNDSRLSWVPIDLTLLFFLISVGIAFIILVRRRFRLKRVAATGLLLLLTLAVWILLSSEWSPSVVYSREKAIFFSTLVLWCYGGAAIIISPETARLRRLLALIVIFGVVLMVESFAEFGRSGIGSFINVMGGNYIGVGRTLGLALSPLIALLLTARPRTFHAVLIPGAALLTLGMFAVMASAGARGPLLSTIGSVLALAFFSPRLGSGVVRLPRYAQKALALSLLIIVAVAALVALSDNGPRTLTRLSVLFEEEGGGVSASGRVDSYKAAIRFWKDSAYAGNGVGSFPVLLGLPDKRAYPHNILLELLVEQGAVGLLLFLALSYLVIRRFSALTIGSRFVLVSLFLLTTNAFLNSMVSGDLTDNRLLFMAFGLVLGCSVRAETQELRAERTACHG